MAQALRNSPQLPIARENLEAARQRSGAARVLLNPTLQAVPRLFGSRQAADTEIVVSQPLDVFGKRRAQAGVLTAQVRGAQAAQTVAERTLIVQVKNAAAGLFAAQEAENLGVTQVEVARLFRDAAARRAQLGDVPAVQVQRADLELLRTENELTVAQADRLSRLAALNQLLGQAPETSFRVTLPLSNDFAAALNFPNPALPPTSTFGAPGTSPVSGASVSQGTETSGTNTSGTATTPPVGSSAQVGSNLVGSNLVAQREAFLPGALERPDIRSARAQIEAQEAEVRAIARRRYPDIELQVRRGSFFGQGSGATAVRAVVSIPLFDLGSIGREKKAAQAEARASRAQLTLLQNQAATQVEQALIRLIQQRQTVERYRIGIVPQTLDLLRKTQIGYAQGATTYLEVLDAQRTLRAVQTEYLQALVGTRTSEAALEGALGGAIPTGAVELPANPSGAAALPGTAAPGTIPEGTIPSNPTEPLNPPSLELPGTTAPVEADDLPPGATR